MQQFQFLPQFFSFSIRPTTQTECSTFFSPFEEKSEKSGKAQKYRAREREVFVETKMHININGTETKEAAEGKKATKNSI